MKHKILMTLALLLTAVTGAWATEPRVINSEISHESLKVGDILVEGFSISGPYSTMFYFNAGRAKKGETLLTEDVKFYKGDISSVGTNAVITVIDGAYFDAAGTYTPIDENGQVANAWIVTSMNGSGNSDFHLSGYKYVAPAAEPAEPAIEVKWDPATKTGNFTMPAYDVEIAPIYAPVAQWAKVENVDQLPTAIEGIYAESTDAIVTAGTVAKIGETENVQGTVMYAVGTSATEQPALTAFSADVPTAKDITAAGDVYVWYYIKGADAPEGEEATAENTFNDSEICATPITVTVLSNKFDIEFKAANANTIEAGKATVTVGGTAATVTEDKLTGVKMGSEVKVKAKDGYKFRKVEAKKKAAPAKPEYADNAEELPANTKLYMRTDLVYNGDWIWNPTYTAEQAQAVANYYAAITGTKCAVIYGHGSGTDIYYVTSDNGVNETIYRNKDLTEKFPGYKVYLLK